ncbi:small EDRK-rich factor 2-like isoform X1 [Branchiostoma floridae x Branchiostoma japonicum]
MTRGNQRELARAKNMKKQQEQAKKKAAADKGSNKGQGLEARKQRDADIMREKQAKKAAAKAETGAKGATGGK